jgi:hypothetical protein
MDDETDADDRLAEALTDNESVRDEIMERVRAKYISSDRDQKLEEAIESLIKRTKRRANPGLPASMSFRPEARAVAVVGNSGAGKTTGCERLFARHPAFAGYDKPGCSLISVVVPGSCTLRVLGRLILEGLGYPLLADRREHIVLEMMRQRLYGQNVGFLHLDEIQNITTAANVVEADRIRNWLKTFLNNKRKPIALILSGLPEITGFLQADTQIRRRTRFLEFQSLTTADINDAYGILVDFAAVAELSVDPAAENTLVPRLLHAALFEMGTMIELIHEAIDEALSTDAKQLTMTAFAAAYADRTGSAASANPFVARDWHNVNCSVVLAKDRPDQRPANSDKAPGPNPDDKPKRHKRIKRGDW